DFQSIFFDYCYERIYISLSRRDEQPEYSAFGAGNGSSDETLAGLVRKARRRRQAQGLGRAAPARGQARRGRWRDHRWTVFRRQGSDRRFFDYQSEGPFRSGADRQGLPGLRGRRQRGGPAGAGNVTIFILNCSNGDAPVGASLHYDG